MVGIETPVDALDDLSRDQLARLLHSKTFAASPSSRRLLKYLVERTAAGDSELKEYSIGVDVFGKPQRYDPQRDSTVRIQIGRLRQKVTEYYGTEGLEDPVILDIPKGGFRVVIERRVPAATPPAGEEAVDAEPARGDDAAWRRIAIGASIGFVLLLAYVVRGLAVAPTAAGLAWGADLEQIWGPLVRSPQPLLISIGTPLFVELQGTLLFRDRGEDNWEKALASDRLAAVRAALGQPAVKPSYYYAAAGEVGAAFSLAKALSPRKRNISLVRDVQLSWQQLADNNVLFLGPPRFFRDRLGDMPVALEILPEPDAFRVLHPKGGEAGTFPKAGVQGDGEAYALVTHSPGPGGKGNLVSFMSNDTFGRLGAVQAFIDPDFAHTLVEKMRNGSGAIPQFYQVMLRIKLKGGVTTDISYVLHRELVKR